MVRDGCRDQKVGRTGAADLERGNVGHHRLSATSLGSWRGGTLVAPRRDRQASCAHVPTGSPECRLSGYEPHPNLTLEQKPRRESRCTRPLGSPRGEHARKWPPGSGARHSAST